MTTTASPAPGPAAAPDGGALAVDPTDRVGSRSPLSWPRRIDAALTAPGPARTLVQVRTFLGIVLGLRLLFRWWSQAARLPDALFEPVFIVSWMGATPSKSFLIGLQVLGLVGVAMVVARRWPHAGYVIAWACLATLCGVWSSAGKIMHNDVMLLSASFPLLFAPAPKPDEYDTVDARWGWGPRACLVVVATVYFATGYQKLVHSGLDWVTGDNMRWVLWSAEYSKAPGLGRAVADTAWLTHLFAGGALLLELTAPLLLAIRRTRPVFPLLSLAMHGSIWLFMGLDYYGWVLATMAVTWPLCTALSRQRNPTETDPPPP